MVDIFARLEKNAGGPIGQYMRVAHGYFAFPKLEGELGPHMRFRGKMMLNWSLNNYLGLANHPEVREADARGAAEFGMAAPMGARMMSGQTKYHEQLERELAAFVGKEDAFLLNFGYQGMISIIDCLLSPRALDVVVYDAEAHACIMDGLRLYKGKRFMYAHNDMESLRLQLKHATELAEQQGGGVLVITEGVFGMKGDCGKLDEIVALKKEFPFRLLVDDAHGFGTMGPGGRGTAAHYGVVDGVDVREYPLDELRARIGMVLQTNVLFTGTIRENIRYGKLTATDEEVYAAAQLAGADSFIHLLPDGYDTVLTGGGTSLSQGQRQLLSIARAAVADPPVMILDEATSSIDTRTEAIVQQGMDSLMYGRTVFVIAHRLSTIRNSDVIMVLDHGHIIERGNHEKLLAEKGTYYQLYTGAFELE